MRQLAERAATAFATAYGRDAEGVWFAPGRVNLVGEHTDYNDGFVLPMALPYGTVAAVAQRDDDVLVVRSLQEQGEVSVRLPDVGPGAPGGWGAYVAGVTWALRDAGHHLTGLDVLVHGDVPPGAGLSSSHSLECAVAVACEQLFGLELSRTELALLVQRAENEVVGAPTGIMDQMASLHGQAGHALFLDCRSLEVTPLPFDPPAEGLALLVVDTRTPHRLVDGQYADRRLACGNAAEALGLASLRDVPVGDTEAALKSLPDPLLRRRARHVLTENARVLAVAEVLRSGAGLRSVGPLLTESHCSMRDNFEITVPQVDAAVAAALAAGAHGARMTGGGFGGCVIALVDDDRVETTGERIAATYAEHRWSAPVTMVVTPGPGAQRVY